ncbi:MAG TPA: hypothetical protein VMT34_00360 [Aggregatilineales bacterium]|nr:hypothetical protein [Aggregatilineales bacterium]
MIGDWDEFRQSAQQLWGSTRQYLELGQYVERLLQADTQPALADLQTKVGAWDEATFNDFQAVVQTMIAQATDYMQQHAQQAGDQTTAIQKAKQRIAALQGVLIYSDRFHQPLPDIPDFKSYIENIASNPLSGTVDLRRRVATWDAKVYARFKRILKSQIEIARKKQPGVVEVLTQIQRIAEASHQAQIAAPKARAKQAAPAALQRDELAKVRQMIEEGKQAGQMESHRYATLKKIVDEVAVVLNDPEAEPEQVVANLTRLRALVDEVEKAQRD